MNPMRRGKAIPGYEAGLENETCMQLHPQRDERRNVTIEITTPDVFSSIFSFIGAFSIPFKLNSFFISNTFISNTKLKFVEILTTF